MKKKVLAALLVGVLSGPQPLYAEWVSLSKGLPDPDILSVVASGLGEGALYAASSRRVYRFDGDEKGWKQVLSLRGAESRVRQILLEAGTPGVLYVASDKGVQKSTDKGKHWKWLYRGIGGKAKSVYCLLEDPADASFLWLGTGQGLVRASKNGISNERLASFPAVAVYSIWSSQEKPLVLAGSASSVYQSTDGGAHWTEVVFGNEKEAGENNPSQPLAQFQIEELRTVALTSSLVYVPAKDRLITSSVSGLLESSSDGIQWKKMAGQALPSHGVRYLAASADTFYAATSRGVFQWDDTRGDFNDLSAGLPSTDVRSVFYDSLSGDLYAATHSGVYRYPKPEFKTALALPVEVRQPADLLALFRHEPSVRDIQQAAIRYAEVSPEKIERWRAAASRKALFPTLSVGTDRGENQNVDLDRGGTNDADRFIIGPEEKTLDWHADLSWDLGDLIWNGDQTSIDTRSKLMVELRDDILNEVTHLYFERRRLQTDLVLAPPASLPLQVEKELKLQEITADIDALTGGFLSQKLKEAATR